MPRIWVSCRGGGITRSDPGSGILNKEAIFTLFRDFSFPSS